MDKPMNRMKEVLEERGIKQTRLTKKLSKSSYMVNAYDGKAGSAVSTAKILNIDIKELIKS